MPVHSTCSELSQSICVREALFLHFFHPKWEKKGTLRMPSRMRIDGITAGTKGEQRGYDGKSRAWQRGIFAVEAEQWTKTNTTH